MRPLGSHTPELRSSFYSGLHSVRHRLHARGRVGNCPELSAVHSTVAGMHGFETVPFWALALAVWCVIGGDVYGDDSNDGSGNARTAFWFQESRDQFE